MGLLGERNGEAPDPAAALPRLSSETSSVWPSASRVFNI